MWPQWQHTVHSVSEGISVKLSARWGISPNHRSFMITVSLSSTLITVILLLIVRFSWSARMASMAVSDNSHFGVQASCILLAPVSISLCMSSIHPGSLTYHFRSTTCIRNQYHFWCLVASMILWLNPLAADRIVSLIDSSSILLVAVVSSSSLRLPSSLFVIGSSRTCVGIFLALKAVLTASTMSATSPQLSARAPAFWGRIILPSVFVGSLTSPGNSTVAVLPWVLLRPSIVVCIFLLTVCHCCAETFKAPLAAMIAILGGRRLSRRWVENGV